MPYNQHYQEYKPINCKEQKVFLECGQGSGSKTFFSTDDTPFQIAFVTLETIRINKKENLIKFSSSVRLNRLDALSGAVKLQYELLRSCDGEEAITLGSWIFEKSDIANNRFNTVEESFNFVFCDSSKCVYECNYFVRVTPLEITNYTATVSNGRIAALSQVCLHSVDYDNKKFDINSTIACGKGNGGIVFKEDGLRLASDIAHVSVDVTGLMKPKILIEFSSIIKLAEDIEDVILRFDLLRGCDEGEPVLRGSWIFEATDSDILVNRAFSFIYCDIEDISDCCDYFVRVTPLDISEGGGVDDDVTVYSARMIAVIQSSNVYPTKDPLLKCTQSKNLLLACGTSTGSRTFTSQSDQTFQLANVSVDTSCLCKPIVNIQFSSLVSYQLVGAGEDLEASIQLRYELFRKCENKRTTSLGVWEFERTENGAENIAGTETFDFVYCDRSVDPGCCDYFVTVTAIEIIEGTDILSVATVGNGRIAALAEGKEVQFK
ncbi:DUF4489 domain-containing protein [Vallitalea okinawensis]|uniref:DUF4489 domain-containing protein n=1 Tax=Vallitalea okinawensis TaxID=2078660 RepID=UPI000CFD1480|nr:DUF4489 domain-containing protein [Vallitalea okinawensis]